VTESIEVLRRRLRSGTLPEALLQPGRDVVLRAGDRSITRDELRERAGQVAGGLHDLGLNPGDRVALYAANSLDWVVAYLGVQRAGGCVVLMNPDYHRAEAEHILHDSEPAFVIADGPRAKIGEEIGPRIVQVETLPLGASPGMPALTPESAAAILYTSGTTGRPKGALLDHGNFRSRSFTSTASAWACTGRC